MNLTDPTLTLTIRWNQTSKAVEIDIQPMILDPILLYGVLEAAKDCVRNAVQAQAKESKVAVVKNFTVPGSSGNGGRG